MVYRLVYTSIAGGFYIQYGAGAEKKVPFFMPISETTIFPNSVTTHPNLESATIGRSRFANQDNTKDVKIQYKKDSDSSWSYVVEDATVHNHLAELDTF